MPAHLIQRHYERLRRRRGLLRAALCGLRRVGLGDGPAAAACDLTPLRRTLALWLLLFAAYAATLGLAAAGSSDYAGDEPHYLRAAESIVERREARPGGQAARVARGGFPLLIAPAYALAGAKGVELFLAALAALAVALAYRLALRVVPDPWSLAGAAAVGLSPPLLAYGTAVYPELQRGGGHRGRRPAGGSA